MTRDGARALLLIDDEPAQGRLIGAIAARAGWRMLRAERDQDAMLLLGSDEGQSIDAVLVDYWWPGSEGIALVEKLAILRADLPILVLTAQSKVSTAVDAMRAGASDFLTKPIAPDRLLAALEGATDPGGRRGELRPLTERTPYPLAFDEIVGSSPAFRTALAIAAKAARARVPVLIEGERGVGKEVFARAIHAASPRARRPFHSIGCASVPANLIESALFGHERGAFAGAFDTHEGKFAEADGATLLLDDVGALSMEMQARLLQAVQHGSIQPVGARMPRDIDVRVIASAAPGLIEQVGAGNFREDLYYALGIVQLTIPPLRTRKGDIPGLARHLLTRLAQQPGLRALGITDDALALLMRYDWPGNVRQLQDTLFRAAVACEGAALTSADFPRIAELSIHDIPARGLSRQPVPAFVEGAGITLYEPDGHMRPLEAIEADVIRLAIGHYRGRMTEVARRLGIGRSTLYRKLGELGIDSAA